jgi:signal transduction histidine kinase
MTRIRLTLAGVALALGIPVAMLAWRALDGLSLERAVRHQAVAERAFDEMERVLSAWLEREESRPFEHYRFYVSGSRRSPLADLPAEDFVVGAFQIDPDGGVHTPMQPRDPSIAAARGHWPPAPAVERAIVQVTTLVRETLGGQVSGGESAAKRAAPDADFAGGVKAELDIVERQDPGTTRPLSGPLAGKEQRASKDLADAKQEEESAYALLQRLNTGADRRAARKQKIAEGRIQRAPGAVIPVAPPVRAPSPEREAAPLGASAMAADAAGGSASQESQEKLLDEMQSQQLRALGYVVSEAVPSQSDAAEPAEARPEARDRLEVLEENAVRVALDPMVGLDTGSGRLLLYRTVLVGELGYRQGLVLDREKLGSWLAARALEPSGLSRVATVRFDAEGRGAENAFGFQHRFAEPFDALSARLSLGALPGVGSPGAIYGLVGLLALAGAAGLLAIHRMVGVTVHFAERRSNFVSAVTHELKTPLTAIRMYGEMLRDGLVPSDAKKDEYYGTITDESERLSRLIDNVLEFSRLERGTRDMHWSIGPLGPVLREAADKLRAHAAHESFGLDLEIEDDLPPVRYDRDALLQVIFNLVDNAMKYAGAAETRRVVLEAKRQGEGVELSVRDFGPGVSGRHLSRIFEPFYRGEDEMTRSAKGTGIGLALVRDLAERMGAAVRGANAEGGGFRVAVDFRAAAGESGSA